MMRGQTPALRGIRIFAFSDVVAGLVGQSFRLIHMKAESMDGSKKRETVFNNQCCNGSPPGPPINIETDAPPDTA